MRAWIIGTFFAVLAILMWDDETDRRLLLIAANIWWAAAYVAQRMGKLA